MVQWLEAFFWCSALALCFALNGLNKNMPVMIKIEQFWIEVIHFSPVSFYGLLSGTGQKSGLWNTYAYVRILPRDKAKIFLKQKTSHFPRKSHQKAVSARVLTFLHCSRSLIQKFLNSCCAILCQAMYLIFRNRGAFTLSSQLWWKLSYWKLQEDLGLIFFLLR